MNAAQSMITVSDVAAVALAIVGPRHASKAEKALASPSKNASLVRAVRNEIANGGDPLGDAFIAARAAEERREAGAVYTPKAMIDAMLSWAFSNGTPDRVVDPGCGSGRFAVAAGRLWPEAKIVAIDFDPLATIMTKAALTVHRMLDRADVQQTSYLDAEVPAIAGRTYFIGNPPYVRHHGIAAADKEWLVRSTTSLGSKASGLSGLHIYFFIRTQQLARRGDVGVFVTSSEWLDVNYGQALRQLLAGQLGGESVHVVDPAALPFDDAMTTAAITCFRPCTASTGIRFHQVRTSGDLGDLRKGKLIKPAEARSSRKWTNAGAPMIVRNSNHIELGEIARVSRGQVTGSNSAWIDGAHAKGVPDRFKVPCVTRAKELISAGLALSDPAKLKRLINLPTDLSTLTAAERRGLEPFLDWCRKEGVPDGYVASHRKAWHAIGLYEPAPILCTYMARRAPVFVRNLAGARHINIAHGIYPRQKMSEAELMDLVARLNACVRVESGRTYAGGLTKFEPKEIERIVIPAMGA